MTLVAGIDSSTQSCKVLVRDAGTGASSVISPAWTGSSPSAAQPGEAGRHHQA